MKERTFKNWVSFCWSNLYFLYLTIGITTGIIEIIKWNDLIEALKETAFEGNFGYFSIECIMIYMGLLIPSAIISIIIYKGMYQHWNDWTNGRTR